MFYKEEYVLYFYKEEKNVCVGDLQSVTYSLSHRHVLLRQKSPVDGRERYKVVNTQLYNFNY